MDRSGIVHCPCRTTPSELHRLVYELYGLTEEEIAIVEEATTR